MVTSLGRGEVRECVKRRIISAPAGVGQGNHRAYSKWNLVQGVIAAALLRHVRAGSVEQLMIRLQLALLARRIREACEGSRRESARYRLGCGQVGRCRLRDAPRRARTRLSG